MSNDHDRASVHGDTEDHHGSIGTLEKRLLVKIDEAAELLGVSCRTVRRLVAMDELALVKVRGSSRLCVEDIRAYVAGLKTQQRGKGSGGR